MGAAVEVSVEVDVLDEEVVVDDDDDGEGGFEVALGFCSAFFEHCPFWQL